MARIAGAPRTEVSSLLLAQCCSRESKKASAVQRLASSVECSVNNDTPRHKLYAVCTSLLKRLLTFNIKSYAQGQAHALLKCKGWRRHSTGISTAAMFMLMSSSFRGSQLNSKYSKLVLLDARVARRQQWILTLPGLRTSWEERGHKTYRGVQYECIVIVSKSHSSVPCVQVGHIQAVPLLRVGQQWLLMWPVRNPAPSSSRSCSILVTVLGTVLEHLHMLQVRLHPLRSNRNNNNNTNNTNNNNNNQQQHVKYRCRDAAHIQKILVWELLQKGGSIRTRYYNSNTLGRD